MCLLLGFVSLFDVLINAALCIDVFVIVCVVCSVVCPLCVFTVLLLVSFLFNWFVTVVVVCFGMHFCLYIYIYMHLCC